jgi:cytochrome c553
MPSKEPSSRHKAPLPAPRLAHYAMRSPAAPTAAVHSRALPASLRPISRDSSEIASGVRSNSIMTPIARALSSDNIDDVAAYYANTEARFPPLANGDPKLVKRGKQLAESGDDAKGIPGCAACHGARGVGESPTFPYLAGQYAHYTALQLQMWRQGFRRNSPTTMALFAKKLDDQDIAALAAYFEQLQPSSPSFTQAKE